MKKILIIAAAFIIAFILTEIFVSKVIGFPKQTFQLKYILNSKLEGYKYIFLKPNGIVVNYEGGMKSINLNNIGVTGSNVDTNKGTKYIFLNGNSYIESTNMQEQEKIASSIFQSNIKKSKYKYNVINLGSTGYDIYLSYHRTRFFERMFKPSIVIYVIESLGRLEHYFKRHKKMEFEDDAEIGKQVEEHFILRVINRINSNSSFLNLIFSSLMSHNIIEKNDRQTTETKIKLENNTELYSDTLFNDKLNLCIKNFKEKYDEFILVSIINSQTDNLFLQSKCSENGVEFYYNKDILNNENRVDGVGHLNSNGNLQLGNFLYNVLDTHEKKRKN